jgi:hypothetical protein
MPQKVLKDRRRRLDPLKRSKSPLSVPPPRSTRFGSPLVLSRVHWVEPKLVAEITYLSKGLHLISESTGALGLVTSRRLAAKCQPPAAFRPSKKGDC